MIARHGDVTLAWEESGEGPALLLIHGLGYGRWGWGPLLETLAGSFRVISFDNRGIGESSLPPGPYTVEEMAEDAAAVLDAARAETTHVAGTSLGGMIAQELAIGHPGRVERLVLMCTTPGAPGGHPMPEVTARLIAAAPQWPPQVALRRFVENALGPDPDPELVETILARRLAHPQDPAGWAAQAAAGTGYAGGERAAAITAPTLILTGTEDRVVDPRNSELLAALIPDARLERIDGAGHLFFWEHPRLVAKLMTEFLP